MESQDKCIVMSSAVEKFQQTMAKGKNFVP